MDAVTGDLISQLVVRISSLAQEEVKTIRTTKVKQHELIEKLRKIKSVVETAESLPFFEQKEFKSRIIELKGIIYDADDMIEAYLYKRELLKAKGASSITSHTPRREKVRMAFNYTSIGFRKHVSYPYKLGHNIKNFDQQLNTFIQKLKSDHTLQSKLRAPYQVVADNSSAIAKRATTSRLVEGEEVGREGDEEKLKKLLVQGEGDVVKKRSYSIVAIVGKGGLGKTFLAQMVFNDKQVKKHFANNSVWWVCVSEKPNPADLVKKLLEAVFKRDASEGANDLETLCSKLGNAIKDKMFLLVLDDVWDLDWWEKLEPSFQKGAAGSKILITTRNGGLMESICKCNVSKHNLLEFTLEESWKLFMEQVDETEEVLKEKGLIEIGKRIVRYKCGGLPLVIKTVGRLLHAKNSKEEWESVEENPIWSWKMKNDDKDVLLLRALLLSYDDLPPHLKNCFVYCSLFPKDFKMEKEMLTQQWIAHGLIEEKEKTNCVDELVSRCLLENRHADLEDGYLRMHDVIHDLALYIGEEEYSTDLHLVGKNTYHLSMMIDKDEEPRFPQDKGEPRFPQDKDRRSKLRTFLCPEGLSSSLPAKVIGDWKGLRVLQLGNLSEDNFTHSIGKLLHLRYLNLSRSSVLSLDMLHNLPFLRWLELRAFPNIEWLPYLPKVVKLFRLDSLKGWSSREDGKAVIFSCLKTLEISNCPKIEWLPCLPKVEVMKLFKLESFEEWPSKEDGKVVILPCLMTLKIWLCQKIKLLPKLPAVVHLLLGLVSSDSLCFRFIPLPPTICSVDLRFYIIDRIAAEGHTRCYIQNLHNYIQGKEHFVWELFTTSESMSPDHAVNQIGKKHEDMLEDPQAPNHFKNFSLKNYLGKQLPSWFWMDVGGRLKELNLYHCLMLKVLPRLPVVEHMRLEGLRSLEEWWVGDDEGAATFPRLKSLKMDDCPNIKLLSFLPVVEEIKLTRLPKCEGWSKWDDHAEMPYLKQAYVRDCPHLSSFPSSFNDVLQKSFDGDYKIGFGTSSPILGIADESSSSSLPSSSVDNLELWLNNAYDEYVTNTLITDLFY